MIEWSRVRELREEVGEEDFEEVVELFLEEVEEVIGKLQATTDRSSLGADMHFLKGSAMSFGFDRFSTLCNEGASAAYAGNADAVDLTAIVQSFTEAKDSFLANYTAQLAA